MRHSPPSWAICFNVLWSSFKKRQVHLVHHHRHHHFSFEPAGRIHDSHTQEQTNAILSDLSSLTHLWESWQLRWIPSGTKAESPAAVLCCVSHPFCPLVVAESTSNRFLWTLASSAIDMSSLNAAGSKVHGFRVQSAHTAWEKGKDTSLHRQPIVRVVDKILAY